jgi:hypothetical protein
MVKAEAAAPTAGDAQSVPAQRVAAILKKTSESWIS